MAPLIGLELKNVILKLPTESLPFGDWAGDSKLQKKLQFLPRSPAKLFSLRSKKLNTNHRPTSIKKEP